MIKVRFPSGFSFQYNDANFVSRKVGFSDLLTEDGGAWIAQVPNDCLIEIVRPCRMYQGVAAESDALLALTKEIRSLKRKLGVKP